MPSLSLPHLPPLPLFLPLSNLFSLSIYLCVSILWLITVLTASLVSLSLPSLFLSLSLSLSLSYATRDISPSQMCLSPLFSFSGFPWRAATSPCSEDCDEPENRDTEIDREREKV